MGKHGPCHHCGVTSTPLWRNGPPDKPVLCNACGSRWRTKGTLTNYTPLHARDSFEVEESKLSNERKISFKFKEKLPNVKWNDCNVEEEPTIGEQSSCFRQAVDEDMSNRSNSGSAVSYAESCAQFSGADVCDISGSLQSNAWDSVVPSRKRTVITRPKPPSIEKFTKDLHSHKKPSSVEKLTKDLHFILHQEASYSVSSEEDLLYENGTPMGSLEIGHGAMLIKHPKLVNIEEESEASSLPANNNAAICTGLPVPVHTQGLSFPNICNGRLKSSQAMVEQPERVKSCDERFNILQDRTSILGLMDLKNITSFEGFTKFLTSEEQQQLMKYLPSIDVFMHLESLKCMFASPQFMESISFFQQLLREGIFDLTFSKVKTEDCKNLKRIALSNLAKSTFIEQYYELLKGTRSDESSGVKSGVSGMDSNCCSTTAHLKRPRESVNSIHNNDFSEAKIIVKSPTRLCITWSQIELPTRNLQRDLNRVNVRSTNEDRDYTSQDSSSCSPRTPASAICRNGIFSSLQFLDASPDQELLLDVRSNTSFPEAELLPEKWVQNTTADNFCTPHGVPKKEGGVSYHSAITSSSNQPNTESR